jgi:hypothetical protein
MTGDFAAKQQSSCHVHGIDFVDILCFIRATLLGSAAAVAEMFGNLSEPV